MLTVKQKTAAYIKCYIWCLPFQSDAILMFTKMLIKYVCDTLKYHLQSSKLGHLIFTSYLVQIMKLTAAITCSVCDFNQLKKQNKKKKTSCCY